MNLVIANIMERAFGGHPVERAGTEFGSITLSDLNEDCLREILEHLDLRGLTSFADTCNRFSQVAQAHFPTSKFKHWNSGDTYNDDGIFGVSRVSKNVGAYIMSIDVRPIADRCGGLSMP